MEYLCFSLESIGGMSLMGFASLYPSYELQ